MANSDKNKGNVLIVDDNAELLLALQLLLKDHFRTVDVENNPERLLQRIKSVHYDVILLDMNFKAGVNTGNEGIFWLHKILNLDVNMAVVFITAYGDVQLALKAIREGAADFIEKSWDDKKIVSTVISAYKLRISKVEIGSLKTKQKHLNENIDSGYVLKKGSSPLMEELYKTIDKVSSTHANILLLGENGTGKEIIAREIHRKSNVSEEIFMHVDVGALQANLFESELFGHEKGAFTDAKNARVGRFEVASGGTLFLDEIGNLEMSQQVKLLAVLQNMEVVRVGGNLPIPVNFRLICATNQNLYDKIEKGTFREDLLYRINTIKIDLPPLRKRTEDIAALARFFLKKYSAKYAKTNMQITETGIRKLLKHPWHGNIRELEHAIEKAVILSKEEVLSPEDLGLHEDHQNLETINMEENYNMADNEKVLVENALIKFEWNLSQTSRALGINRSTLYDKIKKYGL